MLSFQISQSSIINKLLISYDLPPALLTFSFERHERRMSTAWWGVREAENVPDCNRSYGGGEGLWWGSGVTQRVRGWKKRASSLRTLGPICTSPGMLKSRALHTGSSSQASVLPLSQSESLLPTLFTGKAEKQTVPIVEGGLCYQGERNILTEAGRFYTYRKGSYSHFTDSENHPRYTIRYSEYFRIWAPGRTGAVFQIPCPEFQQVCN